MIFTIYAFFLYIVEALILKHYADSISVTSKGKANRISFLILIYFCLFFVYLLNIHWLNTILFLMANFIYLLYSYQLRWYSALFHGLITTIAMGMSELLIYSLITHFISDFFEQNYYVRNLIILAVFSKILYFFILNFLSHIIKKNKIQDLRADKTPLLLSSIPLITLCIMLTILEICESIQLSHMINTLFFLCVGLLLLMNILIFTINSYRQHKNEQYMELQLQLQKETNAINYYQMLLQQNETQSILIHDVKKHLQSINTLNDAGETEKIRDYIHQLVTSSNLKENLRLCNHEILNAILCRYQKQAKDSHISFLVDIRKDTISFMSDNDVTALFCNLLDNAYESASLMSDAFIELNLTRKENTNFTLLTMVNSCRTDPFNGKPRILPASTKPGKYQHGYGLKSILKIAEKYHGAMQVYYDAVSYTFHTILTLKSNDIL